MQAQQQVSFAKNKHKVGQTLEVIIDDYGDLPGDLIGRSKFDAPGIDGTVFAVFRWHG